jgi:hypothetical protein
MQRYSLNMCQQRKIVMKNNKLSVFLFVLTCSATILLLEGCHKDNTRTYTILKPVYKDKASVLAAINGSATESFLHPGKIYIKDNLIFINEIDKGIHVIDNSDPSHPQQISFLDIPGNEDIAVKGNILYADMYADLLAIDITDPQSVHVTGKVFHFFMEREFVNGFQPDSNQVIVDWIKKDTTVVIDQNPVVPPIDDCRACMFMLSDASAVPASNGQAGSMAKMVLLKDYLYAISERHSLGIVSVTNASSPHFENNISAGFDLETIYPFEDKLFLGSAEGMFMFDVSDPIQPFSIGTFSHGRACDPVVSDGKYAYITLHAGTECGGNANELDVVNIENLDQSQLVKTYPMTKPTGLCKDGSLLFVCDASVVKIYDAADPSDLKLLNKINSNEPYDVIAHNNVALVVDADGLYQYDYSNVSNIRQLSFISVKE